MMQRLWNRLTGRPQHDEPLADLPIATSIEFGPFQATLRIQTCPMGHRRLLTYVCRTDLAGMPVVLLDDDDREALIDVLIKCSKYADQFEMEDD